MSTQKVNNKTQTTNNQLETDNAELVKTTRTFTPRRFSVRGLRKHTGIKTSRTPRVAF